MKKFFVLLLTVGCMQLVQVANADPAANIKIKISGATKDNKYFLCIPSVGCLSILAAQKGKVYPVFRPVEMDNMFIANQYSFRVKAQGLPNSCNVTVNTNQTITIYGNLVSGPNNSMRVSNLRCSLS